MKRVLAVLLMGIPLLGLTSSAVAEQAQGKQKVVYHVNSDDPKLGGCPA